MEKRPTRLTAFLIIAVIGIVCIGSQAFAGLNTNGKVSVLHQCGEWENLRHWRYPR